MANFVKNISISAKRGEPKMWARDGVGVGILRLIGSKKRYTLIDDCCLSERL